MKLQKMPPLTGLGIYLAWVFYIDVSPTGFNLWSPSSCYRSFALKLVVGGAATFFRQSCVFRVFVGKPAFAPVLRSNTAEGGKTTARQVVKNIFVKVGISGVLLGFREKIAVVANDDSFRQGGKMAG